MTKLTEKQRKFVQAKLNGKDNREAAIIAGYSEHSASMTGSQLMNNPRIKDYLDSNLKADMGSGGSSLPLVSLALEQELEAISDPLEYLRSVYTDHRQPEKLRIEAAKAALPYVHGKVPEIGKKQSREDEANDIANHDDVFATRAGRLS